MYEEIIEYISEYIYKTTSKFFEKCYINSNDLFADIANCSLSILRYKKYKNKLVKYSIVVDNSTQFLTVNILKL